MKKCCSGCSWALCRTVKEKVEIDFLAHCRKERDKHQIWRAGILVRFFTTTYSRARRSFNACHFFVMGSPGLMKQSGHVSSVSASPLKFYEYSKLWVVFVMSMKLVCRRLLRSKTFPLSYCLQVYNKFLLISHFNVTLIGTMYFCLKVEFVCKTAGAQYFYKIFVWPPQ